MWNLSSEVRHLNHGSFGAVPDAVSAAQTEWRRRWEANPTRFVHDDLIDGLDKSRTVLAEFLGAEPGGIGFVRNASLGVAAVAHSYADVLEPGDEIVITNHEYNAVRQTFEFSARRSGAVIREVEIPFPLSSEKHVAHRVLDLVGPNTKLVVIDHLTSPTGLLLPVEEIVDALEPEIPVLVDGAHGPGQVMLNLDALGASWYTGNLHKWMCAPKGSAFLYTRADRRDATYPTVISHAWNTPLVDGASRYQALFDWTGTDDFSSWLAIPEVISFVGGLHAAGWPGVMSRNHELALRARDVVCRGLGIDAPAPDSMVASMFGVPLPPAIGRNSGGLLSPLNDGLLNRGFETVVSVWPSWPHQVLRLSCHLYNEIDDYEALVPVLNELVG